MANINESWTETEDGMEMSTTIKAKMTMVFSTENTGIATAKGNMSTTFMGESISEPMDETVDFTYTFDGSKATITQVDEDGETNSFDLTLNSDKTALVGSPNGYTVEFYLQ